MNNLVNFYLFIMLCNIFVIYICYFSVIKLILQKNKNNRELHFLHNGNFVFYIMGNFFFYLMGNYFFYIKVELLFLHSGYSFKLLSAI